MFNEPATRRELCRALGFLAVLLKDGPTHLTDVARTQQIADLLEEYCRLGEKVRETNPDQSFTLADCMARTISGHIRKRVACQRADLLDAGFSESEIRQHWDMAYALAHVHLNKTPESDC